MQLLILLIVCLCCIVNLFSFKTSKSAIAVEFVPAKIKGEAYRRPLGASKLAIPLSEITNDLVTNALGGGIGVSKPITCDSQQVHVSFGDVANSMYITFASDDINANTILFTDDLSKGFNSIPTIDSGRSYSQLLYIDDQLYAPPMGEPSESRENIILLQNSSRWAYSINNGKYEKWANWKYVSGPDPIFGLGAYNNPYMVYDSNIIKTAYIQNLTPGKTYYYKPSESCESFEFTMPREAEDSNDADIYPYMIGLIGDSGQTLVSVASFNALISMNPEYVLFTGDLSYADGFYPLWDTFANLIEPLASKVPILTVGGNHEYGNSEQWLSYTTRYPSSYRGSGSTNPCYFGKEIGPTHVIGICSYAGFTSDSKQYQWLANYLDTRINRKKTPWLIVLMHVPFYCTNNGHWMEGELIRQALEGLLYQYGVDVFLVGHVHAYERTYPMYNNQVDECGGVHLTLGDGGNYEGAYVPWRDPQELWSVFRESSFGVSSFQILSATQVNVTWNRHACDSEDGINYNYNFSDSCVTPKDNSAQRMLASDSFLLTKPDINKCPNRYKSSDNLIDDQSNANSNNDNNNDDNTKTNENEVRIALICLTVFFALLSLYLGFQVWILRNPSDFNSDAQTKLLAKGSEGSFRF